jgi:hypothetical protein
MEQFPQDGSPITRAAWLSPWPRSKKGNEWVRAFGLTYTLIETPIPVVHGEVAFSTRLTVVGLGGRFDKTLSLDADSVKEWLWPESSGYDAPFDLEELVIDSEVEDAPKVKVG